MTQLDIERLVIAGMLLAVAVVAVLVVRWRRRDQEFVGLTPGLLPAPGRTVGTRRVRGAQEWKGTVAPAFAPPPGIGPAVAGTVVDGRVDGRDLAAMLVDLSLRGFFSIEPLRADGTPSVRQGTATPDPHPDAQRAKDWIFVQNPNPPAGHHLSVAERRMLGALFAGRERVQLSALKVNLGLTLRQVQIDLYREMIDRGWYRKHPRSRSAWTTVFAVLLVLATVVLASGAAVHWRETADAVPFVFPAATFIGSVLFFTLGRGRVPRTAEGTAARVQTLGFEKYLATAEADQIRYEEAVGLFSRYLPFAIVFGLADRWAKVIGEVVRRAQLDNAIDLIDLGGNSIDLLTALGENVAMMSDGIGALIDLGGSIDGGLLDVSGAFESFTDAASGLFDDATGCLDGCDGCDGGCLDF